MKRIGFIGAGNMAEALIRGVIDKGVMSAEAVFVSDVREERLKELSESLGVCACVDNEELVGKCDVIFLSVKPQVMADVLKEIESDELYGKLFVSIAAGITIEKITGLLGDVAVVRVMPNTPALVGEGASAMFANEKAKTRAGEVQEILAAVGAAEMVEKEADMDAVTALSGSGPAYFFYLLENMIAAGIEMGLSEETATRLAIQTGKGASLLAEAADEKGESCSELRRKVTSPGGTTEAALNVFDENKAGEIIKKALKRACERSKELSA